MHLKQLCTIAALTLTLYAQDPASELDALFSESSSLVAQSKLNVDYTPSIISVLYHDELQKLGVSNLFEALGLLPGIETSITQNNHKKVTIRRQNLPNSHTYQKAKLVIDGVSIETAMYGNSDYYMNLPVELIKRIEVLRGPGSSLYGTGAFNGVISVTTFLGSEQAESKLFGSVGSSDYAMGGFLTHHRFNDGTEIRFDGYYQSDNERIKTDSSFVHENLYEPASTLPVFDPNTAVPVEFTRPYEGIGDTNDFSIGIKVSKDHLKFDARFKKNREGNLFGWDEYLETADDYDRQERYLFARLAYENQLNRTLSMRLEGGYNSYRFENTAQMYEERAQEEFAPSEFLLTEREHTWFGGVTFSEEGYADHHITAGAEFHTTRLDKNRMEYRFAGLLMLGPELFPQNLKRDVSSLYANDSINLTPSLDALISLRYDYYSDHDEGYPSLQLGTIYKQPTWRLKFNYGHAYKVPNWVELYARIYNTDVKNPLVAETSDGIDLIMIYEPSQVHRYKIDLYYAKMHDVIDMNEEDATVTDYSYINLGSRTSYGLEAEYDYSPSPAHRLHANLSYSRSTYISPDEGHQESQVPDTTDLMIKGYYLYYPVANLSLGTTVRYIGDRERQYYPRKWSDEPLDSYTQVDIAATYTMERWQLTATVKNLFDDDIRYGSFYSFHDGIPGSGRQWYINLKHHF